jgi:bacillithiol biosynthesis cysteine-adding enzyme BshC
VQDYLRGAPAARPFFGAPPGDPASFVAKLEDVTSRFGPDERARAAGAVRPTSDRARRRLERFVRDGGAMVTTGQQAGLFTGPLFTIHKALTAVRLASALEEQLGVVVLPLFWIASEDHDWDEVNHAFLPYGSGIRRIDLPAADRRPTPMSVRTLTEDIDTTLANTADLLAGTRYGDRYLQLIREAYQPGVTVAAAFETVIARLLEPFDVLITDAADPVVKAGSIGVLTEALERADHHESLLESRTGALIEAGYHAQVPVLERATNVFYHGAGERERLYRDRGGLVGAGTGIRLSLEEAVSGIREKPGDFSPNVFLRPVVESEIFPTLAYVGGPGEISYFGQLGPLFGEFRMEPPVVCPRASVTLMEEGEEARLGALGFDMSDLRRPRHELVEAVARQAMPRPVREALEEVSRGVSGGYRRVIEEAMKLDETLAGSLGSLRNESLARIGRAERKILRRLKELERERVRELDGVRARLAPGGQPQERVLNVIGFLASYGPELLKAIHEAIQPEWKARVG